MMRLPKSFQFFAAILCLFGASSKADEKPESLFSIDPSKVMSAAEREGALLRWDPIWVTPEQVVPAHAIHEDVLLYKLTHFTDAPVSFEGNEVPWGTWSTESPAGFHLNQGTHRTAASFVKRGGAWVYELRVNEAGISVRAKEMVERAKQFKGFYQDLANDPHFIWRISNFNGWLQLGSGHQEFITANLTLLWRDAFPEDRLYDVNIEPYASLLEIKRRAVQPAVQLVSRVAQADLEKAERLWKLLPESARQEVVRGEFDIWTKKSEFEPTRFWGALFKGNEREALKEAESFIRSRANGDYIHLFNGPVKFGAFKNFIEALKPESLNRGTEIRGGKAFPLTADERTKGWKLLREGLAGLGLAKEDIAREPKHFLVQAEDEAYELEMRRNGRDARYLHGLLKSNGDSASDRHAFLRFIWEQACYEFENLWKRPIGVDIWKVENIVVNAVRFGNVKRVEREHNFEFWAEILSRTRKAAEEKVRDKTFKPLPTDILPPEDLGQGPERNYAPTVNRPLPGSESDLDFRMRRDEILAKRFPGPKRDLPTVPSPKALAPKPLLSPESAIHYGRFVVGMLPYEYFKLMLAVQEGKLLPKDVMPRLLEFMISPQNIATYYGFVEASHAGEKLVEGFVGRNLSQSARQELLALGKTTIPRLIAQDIVRGSVGMSVGGIALEGLTPAALTALHSSYDGLSIGDMTVAGEVMVHAFGGVDPLKHAIRSFGFVVGGALSAPAVVGTGGLAAVVIPTVTGAVLADVMERLLYRPIHFAQVVVDLETAKQELGKALGNSGLSGYIGHAPDGTRRLIAEKYHREVLSPEQAARNLHQSYKGKRQLNEAAFSEAHLELMNLGQGRMSGALTQTINTYVTMGGRGESAESRPPTEAEKRQRLRGRITMLRQTLAKRSEAVTRLIDEETHFYSMHVKSGIEFVGALSRQSKDLSRQGDDLMERISAFFGEPAKMKIKYGHPLFEEVGRSLTEIMALRQQIITEQKAVETDVLPSVGAMLFAVEGDSRGTSLLVQNYDLLTAKQEQLKQQKVVESAKYNLDQTDLLSNGELSWHVNYCESALAQMAEDQQGLYAIHSAPADAAPVARTSAKATARLQLLLQLQTCQKTYVSQGLESAYEKRLDVQVQQIGQALTRAELPIATLLQQRRNGNHQGSGQGRNFVFPQK